MSEYKPEAWEARKLEQLYEDVGWSKNRQHTIQLLSDFSENDILDIGCLDGAYIAKLRENGYSGRYHGVDITTRHIEVAKIKNPNETFSVDDARKLSFKKLQFSTVLFSDVIQHLPDGKSALKEVCRVAKKYVIASTYGSWNETFTRHNQNFLNTYYKKEDFEKLIPKNFKVVSFCDLPHPSLPEDSIIRIFHFVLERIR